MRRRKQDSVLDLVPVTAGLLLLGFYFVPAFRFLVFAGLAVFVLAVLAFVIYRVAVREPHLEISDRKISINTCQPRVAPPASAPKPAPRESLSDKLRKIDWYQFEKLVGAIYQAKGYSVQRMGGAKPDGGADLIIEQAGVKTVVQCKHWKSSEVPVGEIREFLGALTDIQIPNGIFITLKGYTADAKTLAHKHNIQLLEQTELTSLLEKLDWQWNPDIKSALEDSRKFCPKCEREMVLRTSTKGQNAGSQFWGCSAFPRCHYILNCG